MSLFLIFRYPSIAQTGGQISSIFRLFPLLGSPTFSQHKELGREGKPGYGRHHFCPLDIDQNSLPYLMGIF